MKVRDPITGTTYERVEQGIVRVTTPDGEEGIFDEHGRWREGAVRHADLQLCSWVGGGQCPPVGGSQPSFVSDGHA